MKRGRKSFKTEYLIKKLQNAFTILGYSPSQSDLKKLPDCPSRATFRKYFGTLEKAKKIAGIPPFSSGRKIYKKTPLNLRFKVLHRDNFTCQYCGRTPKDGVKLEIDHIIPRKNGGNAVFENLITACSECNQGKKIMNLSHLPTKKPTPMNKNSNHQSRLF